MAEKIAIIGGGINGMTLAESLQARGFEVVVFEAGLIPNPMTPSMLQSQIVRPQYVDQLGLGARVQPALASWRNLFHKLGKNYFTPEGVIAISQEEGDWADRALSLMRAQNLPFRYVHQTALKDLMPAVKLNEARFGILADWGGHIQGAQLMKDLAGYLREKGVDLRENTAVKSVDPDRAIVEFDGGQFEADWVIVTGGHDVLIDAMSADLESFMGTVADYEIPFTKLNWWRYTPIWVDLGATSNCWGIPRVQDGFIRIGAGSLSNYKTQSDDEVAQKLKEIYGKIIIDFGEYELTSFRRVPYKGYASGEFALKRFGQIMALVADSGHGFKFAADNARAIADALVNDRLSFAAREIAGV